MRLPCHYLLIAGGLALCQRVPLMPQGGHVAIVTGAQCLEFLPQGILDVGLLRVTKEMLQLADLCVETGDASRLQRYFGFARRKISRGVGLRARARFQEPFSFGGQDIGLLAIRGLQFTYFLVRMDQTLLRFRQLCGERFRRSLGTLGARNQFAQFELRGLPAGKLRRQICPGGIPFLFESKNRSLAPFELRCRGGNLFLEFDDVRRRGTGRRASCFFKFGNETRHAQLLATDVFSRCEQLVLCFAES